MKEDIKEALISMVLDRRFSLDKRKRALKILSADFEVSKIAKEFMEGLNERRD